MKRLFHGFRAAIMITLSVICAPLHADDVPLRSGDQLTLRLAGVPMEEISQVTGVYSVDGAGDINVPYLGKVHAAGLKQAEVQASIEALYKSKGI